MRPSSLRAAAAELLEPQIDGKQVQLTGEVNDEAKRRFLAGAAALLFPIDWPEPFGLLPSPAETYDPQSAFVLL
jgi:glycosyltransferase involved in cell wall biosynthesis